MEFIEKKAIANTYISRHADGLEWDDLGDINSLHDCDTEEDIIAACNERLEAEGYPMELLEEEDDDEEKEPNVIPEDINNILDSEEDDDEVFTANEY